MEQKLEKGYGFGAFKAEAASAGPFAPPKGAEDRVGFEEGAARRGGEDPAGATLPARVGDVAGAAVILAGDGSEDVLHGVVGFAVQSPKRLKTSACFAASIVRPERSAA